MADYSSDLEFNDASFRFIVADYWTSLSFLVQLLADLLCSYTKSVLVRGKPVRFSLMSKRHAWDSDVIGGLARLSG